MNYIGKSVPSQIAALITLDRLALPLLLLDAAVLIFFPLVDVDFPPIISLAS